jgi:hypothetical protein
MRRVSFLTRAVIGLVLITATVATTAATPAQASGTLARVTFHVARCPENTRDVFNTCHHRRFAKFGIWGCNPAGFCKLKFTDSNGVVFFGPRAGSNRFFVNDLDGFVGTRVYCSVKPFFPTGKVLIDRRDADGNFIIFTRPGDVVICDLYLLTAVDP